MFFFVKVFKNACSHAVVAKQNYVKSLVISWFVLYFVHSSLLVWDEVVYTRIDLF